MGWSVGYDPVWKRDIGYGVPATCDHPGCGKSIHRGLAHVCGGEPYGGDHGCGLHFCDSHLSSRLCSRCIESKEPFEPTADTPQWIEFKLSDVSWKECVWDGEQWKELLLTLKAGQQSKHDAVLRSFINAYRNGTAPTEALVRFVAEQVWRCPECYTKQTDIDIEVCGSCHAMIPRKPNQTQQHLNEAVSLMRKLSQGRGTKEVFDAIFEIEDEFLPRVDSGEIKTTDD